MHAVLLGVVRKLLSLWFDSSFSKELFSLSRLVKKVDDQLRNICPPNFISRTPRSIDDHKAYWKASECRSWLFYYSLPILCKVMDDEYFKHYMLLAESIYTLNMGSISNREIEHCHNLLVHFVSMYNVLYGERYMSANVHNLIHLPKVVKQLGPLWVYSCFPLEDLNGRLLKLFHGTQHPEMQIISAISTLAKLPELNYKLVQNSTCRDFIYKLSKDVTRKTDETKLFGFMPGAVLKGLELASYEKFIGTKENQHLFLLFNRLCHKSLQIPSESCSSIEKRNSFYVQCKVDQQKIYSKIVVFIKHFLCSCIKHPHLSKLSCDHKSLALLNTLSIKDNGFPTDDVYNATCGHVMKVVPENEYLVVEVDAIKEVMCCVKTDESIFLINRPNFVEKD